jgi:DNA-binding transcriptional MerR regulator
MRGRYEVAMRDLLPTAAEDERITNIINSLRAGGTPPNKINEIVAETKRRFGLMITSEQLLEVVQKHLAVKKQKRSETKPSTTNGGKAYDALLVDENELVQYLEMGWELVSVINSKVAISRPTR